MITDQELVDGCCKSDRKYQRMLYEKYAGRLFVVAQRYTKSIQEAEDILQEAMIKVFHFIKTFRSEAKLETWMRRIVINTALNHQRSKLYMFPMVDVENLPLPDQQPISLDGLHLSELLLMIQSLPDGCQLIFNLYAVEGYTHVEIAEMLGISEGTSKSQYARARQLLQQKVLKTETMAYGKA
jgi:RNA polymerase sigma factor (sigma-70 family)